MASNTGPTTTTTTTTSGYSFVSGTGTNPGYVPWGTTGWDGIYTGCETITITRCGVHVLDEATMVFKDDSMYGVCETCHEQVFIARELSGRLISDLMDVLTEMLGEGVLESAQIERVVALGDRMEKEMRDLENLSQLLGALKTKIADALT